jgi:NADH-ubiquinone oxidoreductase chain 4
LYTITASLPLLIGLIVLLHHLNSINIYCLHPIYFLSNLKGWWLILITAFMVKIPIYGTHLWLPKAHVEAPIAGSIILAGILLKLGSYGLLRIRALFPPISSAIANPIIAICGVGGVLTGLTCLRQPDLKALIAYSSVTHIALLTSGVMSNSLWG